MTFRNLCEIYTLLRNNSIQNKIFIPDNQSESKTLVSDDDFVSGGEKIHFQPPKWLDAVQEVNYEVMKIQNKIRELRQLHLQYTNQSSFEDNAILDHEIQSKGHQIIQMLSHSQALVKRILLNSSIGFSMPEPKESTLRKNLSIHYVVVLCDLTSTFRKCQSTFLKQIERREVYKPNYKDSSTRNPSNNKIQNSSGFEFAQNNAFATDIGDFENKGVTSLELNGDDANIYSEFVGNQRNAQANQLTVPFFVEDDLHSLHRDTEIKNLVGCLKEINTIFNDLSHIIVDQGTIVDRIDYNLEHSSITVKTGLQELKKAETYQRKNHKIICVMVLAAVVTIMSIALILLKF